MNNIYFRCQNVDCKHFTKLVFYGDSIPDEPTCDCKHKYIRVEINDRSTEDE